MREWVGIAALAVAVGVAMSFCNPAAGQDTTQRPIELGEPVLEATPEPTPTAIPTIDLPAPSEWFVRYLSSAEPGSGVEVGYYFSDTLDVAYDGAPFPDVADDNWAVTATATWPALEAGRYGFTVEHDGALGIATAAGDLLREEPDPPTARQLRIVFEHDGGPLELTLTARDRGGPLALSWH